MLRTAIYSVSSAFFLIFTLTVFYLLSPISSSSQTIHLTNQKVVYDLPYPGILPDSPFYFIKSIRDRLMEIATRDSIRKAQLDLLYSDKRLTMAQELLKKGKDQLALSTLSKGEKYFLKIPPLLEQSKKQGVTPTEDFIYKVRLSNQKHHQEIEGFFKEFPQGKLDELHAVLDMNNQIREQLSKF